MAHKHSVYDTDSHFTISALTRAISYASASKNLIMQFDHNSERFTFEIPRYVEEHDMLECNKIEIHYLNGKNPGVYEVDDLQISPDSETVVIFSWLVSQNATQLAGSLSFAIRFSCVAEDGTIDYAWNTNIYSNMRVAEGIYNSAVIVEEYADVLEQWKAKLFSDQSVKTVNGVAPDKNGNVRVEIGGSAVGAVLYTEQTLTEEQKAQARENIGTEDWFDKTYETITEETNLFAGLIPGYVEPDGSIPNYANYRVTDYIPITGYNCVKFRITAFETPVTSRMLWAARYDENKNFIEGSRAYFNMYPLDENGELIISETDYKGADLCYIGKVAPFKNGMGLDISADDYSDGTAYIVLTNLYAVDEITMTITGVQSEQGYKYSIPEAYLPDSVTKAINETIPQLEMAVADGDEIPLSDYVPELVDKIALAAKAHMKPDSMCLVLYADTHYIPSRTVFPTVIAKKLAEATNATAIIHLGDLADMANEGKAEGVKIWQKHSNILHGTKIPYMQIVGNHDDASYYNRNTIQDRSAENYLTAAELFQATAKQSRKDFKMGSVQGGYYYMDDEDSKTRLIVLNAHEYPWVVNEDGTLAHDSSAANVESGGVMAAYSPAQLDWLANVALDFSDKETQAEWGVVASAHMGTHNWYNVNTLFMAFKNGTKYTKFSSGDLYNLGYDASTVEIKTDFSQVGPRKIAFLNGDMHIDMVDETTGYPTIIFLNASLSGGGNAPVKTAGTPTETALSVLVVTPSEDKITELRFGAGSKTDENGNAVSYNPLTDYDNYRVVEY